MSQSMRPGPCTASTCSTPLRRVHDLRNLRDRLNHAGFVVGEHHRHQRPFGLREGALECHEIDDAVSGRLATPRPRSAAKRPPLRTEGCSIADTNSRSPRLLTAAKLKCRRQRQHVRFGGAARECDVLRLRPRPESATCARASSTRPSGGAAFGMHGRGIPGHGKGRVHGRAGLLAQGRGRIPVKIGPFRHDICQYLITVCF